MPQSHLKFGAGAEKRRILVVEDEEINQEILAAILQDTYEILRAYDGAEAIEHVRARHDAIRLILLDLNLPDMHGVDILRLLRSEPELARIPVIVMTAETDSEVECLTLGAIDFIPKPYPRPEVIRARVLRTVELSEDRDTIRRTERDQLTGLYNKEYFYRYAAQFDAYHKDIPADALVIDVNHFHIINDRYGKSQGDEVLASVAHKLREIVGESGGLVCRREADTFLIYCPHREDYMDILARAAVAIRGAGKTETAVRLRMGVYANVDKTIDIERRFDRAKLASDTVRNNYTKTIGFYDDSMYEKEVFAEQLIDDFPRAMEEGQFLVYYQPKFDVRPQEPVLSSAEALVRWKHPELGMISPGVFIPLFEDNGLIQELDNYVWHEAAAQIRVWKDVLGVSVPVSVNVSRVDLYDPDLVDKLRTLVEQNGLGFDELLLEVTESAYTEDAEQIVEKVSQLRRQGFQVEMDDFGTGYSSLNMISSLPIDALKLDMQFIRNAFKERKDTRLLEVVIQLAESLDVPTIAEGAETAEQVFTLKSMGCDIVQGYYFSRPVPAAEFEKFLLEKKDHESQKVKKGDRRRMDHFTYNALHDPLTGLYNYSAFDILYHDADKDHLAVLIADVDNYAAIKEQKGRAYTDRLIKHIAGVLRDNFRSTDDVCRIREDEFVIIMTRVTSAMRMLVFDKVETINNTLQDTSSGLMPASLSVGVAFSDRDKPDGDIFQDADTALHRMKEVMRCGCAVY